MRILKVLNNSIVIAEDKNNVECVIFGKGVGFNHKAGDVINEESAEKVFVSKDKKFSGDLIKLMAETSTEYLDITERIVKIAEERLKVKLNNYIHITLTDHLRFAVIRNNEKETTRNWISWEVKKFYPKEYKIGVIALEIIKEELKTELPEDEAGNIAFHIVNAQKDEMNNNKLSEIASIVKTVVNIIRYYFQCDLDEESINYSRFIAHLQHFAQRIAENKMLIPDDDQLFNQILAKYPEEFECTKNIRTYIKNTYNIEITPEEQMYLTLHIKRVVNRANN